MMLPRSRPQTDLSLALVSSDWQKALKILAETSARKVASRWTRSQGFFNGSANANVLPLHQACLRSDVPVSVIRALIQAYPEAVTKAESSFQRWPLHCACRAGTNSGVVELLLQASSQACLHADSLRRLPLHYALSNGSQPVVVNLLLQAAPGSAASSDHKGWTPLHVAVSVGCSLEVCQVLLHACPQSLVARTVMGSTPLQCLIKDHPNQEELSRFLEEAQSAKAPSQKLSGPPFPGTHQLVSLPIHNAQLA